MGQTTGISWTTHTWNPFQGCTKISPGCTNCYMHRDMARYGKDPRNIHRSADATFSAPLAKHGRDGDGLWRGEWKWPDGGQVFTASWSDWGHAEVDPQWRRDAYAVIDARPALAFQVLTKRIAAQLWRDELPTTPRANVWLGTTIEDQRRADERGPRLAELPAALRFYSVEPLLERVKIPLDGIGWVIVGAESGGREARAIDVDAIRDVRDQALAAGVPIFVKQLGSVWARANHARSPHGADPAEWPADLRVQQMPRGVIGGVAVD